MTEGFAAAVDGLLTAWGALDGQLAFVEGKQAVMGVCICMIYDIYVYI